MLKLVLGAAGSGKTALITKEIAEKLSSGERGILFIVPEQYSHEAERELCAVCGDSLSLGAEVLSFTRLADSVSQEMGTGGRVYLDSGGRLLCMSLALKQIAPRLKSLSGAARSGQLQLEILSAVEELKNALVTYDALMEASNACGGELAVKLRDLALCMEAYEAVLSNGHADSADRLTRLANTISESSIGRNSQIYIDGFTDFTGTESRVIEALIASGAPVTVCLTCGGLASDAEHFAPARHAANALLRFAESCGNETQTVFSEADRAKNPILRYYDEHLFQYNSETVSGDEKSLSLRRAADMRAECEGAAARCLEIVRETGCRWRDIAVAARGFGDYSAFLSRTFSFYGIPLFSAKRGNIMQKPVPALISSAFAVILGSWETEDVLSYTKSGLLPVSREDCDTLEKYVRFWDLKGGAWLKKSPWKHHPEGFGRDETEDSKALLARIDGIRRAVTEPLMSLAKAGTEADTAAEQTRVLLDFLVKIRLPETLSAHTAELEDSGHRQLADEFSQIWGVLSRALEQFSALLGESSMTQEEFSELFLKMLSCYDIASIPVSPDAVSAGEIDRMRRRHIKHLIVLGASDDRIPAAGGSGGLLSDDDRVRLETIGIPALGNTDKLSREFSLIYNCVTLPSDSLTISYSLTSSDGSTVSPSFLISRAQLLFDARIRDTDLDVCRLSAAEPAFLLAARGGDPGASASALAREYFRLSREGMARLESLESRAGMTRGNISENVVRRLYGSTLRLSPSRADTFFSCRYQYFLRYGLRLDERERADFSPPELGTYIHYILEKCAAEIARSVGFAAATPELVGSLTDKYTDLYIEEELGGFEGRPERFIFLFQRQRPSVKRVVTDMVRELSRSDFVPLRFELTFGEGGELPPIRLTDGENQLLITGTVDRVDGCWKDGKLILRVVDYKTGKKSFSLRDVWYGMGMQMLLYLFSLERGSRELFGAEALPAGVLYVPANDRLVTSPGNLTEDELAQQRKKDLRRSGLILNDDFIIDAMEHGDEPEYLPVKYKKDGSLHAGSSVADIEQFAAMRGHIDKRMIELAREISAGSIEAIPCFAAEDNNACLFCPYDGICRFDETRDKRRYLKKLGDNEVWSMIETGGCADE